MPWSTWATCIGMDLDWRRAKKWRNSYLSKLQNWKMRLLCTCFENKGLILMRKCFFSIYRTSSPQPLKKLTWSKLSLWFNLTSERSDNIIFVFPYAIFMKPLPQIIIDHPTLILLQDHDRNHIFETIYHLLAENSNYKSQNNINLHDLKR